MGFPSRVFLTGFMASGKSTVGPLLADRLHYHFVDLDEEIERAAQRSIKQIFADDGEAFFRQLESETLRALASRDAIVIATGGGALTNDENIAMALSRGCVVFLDVSADTVLERVAGDGTPRPLLQESENVEEAVRRLLNARQPFYRRAHIRVPADNDDPSSIATTVMNQLIARAGTSADDEEKGHGLQAPRNER